MTIIKIYRNNNVYFNFICTVSYIQNNTHLYVMHANNLNGWVHRLLYVTAVYVVAQDSTNAHLKYHYVNYDYTYRVGKPHTLEDTNKYIGSRNLKHV